MIAEDSLIVYDVIIVGAGPCGLATAARLREKHPSALFTDEEQARYSWISRNSNRASIKDKRTGCIRNNISRHQNGSHSPTGCSSVGGPSMLVLDASSTTWMNRWKTLFRTFEIEYLRSPMFFHPDPSDRDALLSFAFSHDRSTELQEIAGCVGREQSKHKRRNKAKCRNARTTIEIDERDRKDYFAPSTACFDDFCEACRDRYHLGDHIVRQEAVHDIEYDFHSDFVDEGKLFTIYTNNTCYHARTVALAIGAGKPCIPMPFPQVLPPSACHAMRIPHKGLLSPELRNKIKAGLTTNALVIGGGLTSAQIVDNLVKKGVHKVHLLMRGPWKIKPFDVNLEWMSKFKNHQRAAFWTADSFDERLEYVQEARNGGSMTPRFAKILKKHIRDNRLSLHVETTIESQNYNTASESWEITTEPPTADLPKFDYIYFATGMKSDINELDLLQTIRKNHPVESVGGFPTLTDDLMWAPDVPLFVTGKLATLQLGPGAGNLEGARLGAERISWAIEDILSKTGGAGGLTVSDSETDDIQHRYTAGIGSRFEGLQLGEDLP